MSEISDEMKSALSNGSYMPPQRTHPVPRNPAAPMARANALPQPTEAERAFARIARLIDPTGKMSVEEVVGEVERITRNTHHLRNCTLCGDPFINESPNECVDCGAVICDECNGESGQCTDCWADGDVNDDEAAAAAAREGQKPAAQEARDDN